MGKTRLEAFSDGVIAIIITIMVLELKVPHGAGWQALHPVLPVFLSYVLSFVYIGIYWNNHHHMLHSVDKVSGSMLWANLHLLCWLSLFPVATAWMGENHCASVPVALYGVHWDGLRMIVSGSATLPDGRQVGFMATSTDCFCWTTYTANVSDVFSDATFNGNQFIAVGRSTLYTSEDGSNWSAPTPAAARSPRPTRP